jgi:hypothetical protein
MSLDYRDAEIIYGKIQQKQNKKKKQNSKTSTSSMVSSLITNGSTSTRELSKSKVSLQMI